MDDEIMTQGEAERIRSQTARIVAKMRAEARDLAAAGRHDDAAVARRIADSRERAGLRARPGAKIGRA